MVPETRCDYYLYRTLLPVLQKPFHDFLLSVKSIKQATFDKNEKFLIFKSVANIGHQLKRDINTNCLQNSSPTST